MNLVVVVLAAVLAGARADCEACVAGRCHSPRTVIARIQACDQMAVDRFHDILYVHLIHNTNTTATFSLEDIKVRQVKTVNTSGLTVDQEEHVLYTAFHTNRVMKYILGSDHQDIITNVTEQEVDLLFYKDVLYFTTKYYKGLNYIKKDKSRWYYGPLNGYNITDFVIDADDNIYFVADSTVYIYKQNNSTHATEVVAQNKYVLSVDKYGEVYFGDASKNAIYKMDNATKQLVDYAAYQRGTMEKFVFDDDNNIVFHDSADGSVNIWKPEDRNCSIEPPHDKYLIKISSSHASNNLETPN